MMDIFSNKDKREFKALGINPNNFHKLALKKKALADRERLRVKLIPSLKPIWDLDFIYLFLKGGRIGGKSSELAHLLLYKSFEGQYSMDFIRKSKNSIAGSVKAMLETIITQLDLQQYFEIIRTEITNKVSGCKFNFKGVNSIQEAFSLQSVARTDFVWLEEAHQISKEIFDIILPCYFRYDNCKILVTWNPQTRTDGPQLTENEILPEQKKVMEVTYKDNPYLSSATLSYIENIKKVNYKKYENQYLGIPSDSYYCFPKIRECIYKHEQVYSLVKEAKLHWLSCDWGYKDSTAICFFCYSQTEKKVILYDVYYINKLSASDVCAKIKQRIADKYSDLVRNGNYNGIKGLPSMIVDYSMKAINGINRSHNASIADVFINKGFNLLSVKKDRQQRFEKIRDIIDEQKVIISDKIEDINICEVFEDYRKHPKRMDIIDHEHDHLYDAFGYGVQWLGDYLFNEEKEKPKDPMEYFKKLAKIKGVF